MAISNIPLPSFTLVLTSGHHSHRRHPATCVLPPSAPDHLMKTIDLRNEAEGDSHVHYTDTFTSSASQENEVLPTIFEEATPEATPPSSESITKEVGSIKASLLSLFLHKFVFKHKSAPAKKMPSST